MGRRRKHTKYRKVEGEQIATTIVVDRVLWDEVGHLAIDEKKSRAMVIEEALRQYLKRKRRLPPSLGGQDS